jgi:hypothetical protein
VERLFGFVLGCVVGWVVAERYLAHQTPADDPRDAIVRAYMRQVEPPDGEARENPALYDPRLTVTDDHDPFDRLYPENPQPPVEAWYLNPSDVHAPADILEPELEGEDGDQVRIDGKLINLEEAFGEYP